METAIREFLNALEFTPVAWIVVFLSAAFEYVFPPFPGDTVVLAGAFLVYARDWPLALVFLAICLGSIAGMIVDYAFGRWIASRDLRWRMASPRWAKIGLQLDRVLPYFARCPERYLVVNRFLPSIRGLFFVAAGMTSVTLWRVVVFGGLSAVIWNTLLFVLGGWIGANWESLASVLSTYNRVMWALVVAVILTLIARSVWRRRGPG